MNDYQFRTVGPEDLPLIGQWLARPHVREWWGDPVRALGEIGAHLADPDLDVIVVSHRGTPIGYQQCYDAHGGSEGPLCDQPAGTRGIDAFIGEPAYVGRGHGSAFIGLFVEQLFDTGTPRVVTDPDPRNTRAIAAYRKAGFHPLDRRTTLSGEALLMARDARTSA